MKPLATEVEASEQQCHAVSQSRGNLTQEEVQNVDAACGRLASAVGPFRENSVPSQPVLPILSGFTRMNAARNNNCSRQRRDCSSAPKMWPLTRVCPQNN